MKLLHITATHLNLAGGVPVVLENLVKAQNEIDKIEARVLSIKADIKEMNSEYFDYLGNDSFEHYISEFLPDVVIFHSHYYFEYLKLYKILLNNKIPYFIEPHGSFGQSALSKSKFKKNIANSVILKKYMIKAKGFIFLNESEKNDSHFHAPRELIIPNGVVTDNVESIHKKNNDCIFYYIGRYDINHKGLDYLFDALDILEKEKCEYTINFYGTGNEKDSKYVRDRVQNYHHLKVKNYGPIYGKNKDILEQLGVMILTSRYEGFPMTVLEGWKCGNPCLVTDGTNVSQESVRNGVGWRTDLDSLAIAKAIKMAYTDYVYNPNVYIKRCKDYVLRNYGWDVIAETSYHQLSNK